MGVKAKLENSTLFFSILTASLSSLERSEARMAWSMERSGASLASATKRVTFTLSGDETVSDLRIIDDENFTKSKTLLCDCQG